ncbi:MAG: DNA2/NAM7 family helicase, partial [Ureaplasma sp.]|nr:DNA2/NAM7 family helicase [Ureaplasma sp.]
LRLSSLDDKTKQRIREIFSIARRDAKNNVPIKEFITNYYNELKIIFPIWISIPELISQSLPLEKNIFDYGIFDEASQIFMERAYPIVYRCTVKIVAGDDKQLKPTSFFANRAENESQNYEYADNDQVDSLLDRAKVSLWPTYHLRNHYRSNHRDLIQFSNDYIYNNNLEFVNKNGITKHAIEVVNVDSIYDDGVNKEEATTVYELLMQNVEKYNKIIVVTFGIKQSAYIEQLIVKNMSLSQQIFDKYSNGDLIVCSLENVQGNEGDLIILSMTYGKDALGAFRANFGPVFMDGGINRLNVAITRAKEKMIIVKSFLASEMSININNPNAKLFYQFINYCDYLETESTNKNVLTTFVEHKIINEQISNIVNKFVNKNDKYKLVSNYDIGSRIIDFAIIDTRTNETKLAIIVNKFKNNTNIQNMFEIIDQYYFIMDRGYKCY